jgi:hypothetical protein
VTISLVNHSTFVPFGSMSNSCGQNRQLSCVRICYGSPVGIPRSKQRSFHFGWTFHQYVSLLCFTFYFTHRFASILHPHVCFIQRCRYSVFTQVLKTCFVYPLFHLFISKHHSYINHHSRVVYSLDNTL